MPGSRTGGERSWIRRAAGSGEHTGHHNFTVGQRRGLGVGGGEPLLRAAAPTPPRTRWSPVRAAIARDTPDPDPRSDGSTGRAERVDGVRLRYHSPTRDCRVEIDGDPGEAVVALAEPVDGPAPGQVACLLDGDLVVGHGTIV